jgi:hypothetical protein
VLSCSLVYPHQNIVETGADKVEDMADELQKAKTKEKQQTNEISDVALKYEGESLRWNGIIYEASNNTSIWSDTAY